MKKMVWAFSKQNKNGMENGNGSNQLSFVLTECITDVDKWRPMVFRGPPMGSLGVN